VLRCRRNPPSGDFWLRCILGRTLDFESAPLKSLVARKDIAGIAHVMLWTGAREEEAAHSS